MKRTFEVHIDTGNDDDDKTITDMFIDLFSYMPSGVTFKFLKICNKNHVGQE